MTDEINPFQAPASGDFADPYRGNVSFSSVDPDIYVKSGRLHVRNGAELPLFCVETGEPITESDMRTKTYQYCPPWVLLLLLLNILILLIVYFVVRKSCRLRYGLSRELRKKYKKRALAKTLFFIAAMGMLFAGIVSESGALSGGGLVLLVLAVIALFIGRPRLRMVAHDSGDFVFTGCSPQFLRKVESQMHRGYY